VSFVNVVPEAVSGAAKALEGIGSQLSAASSAAAAPTTGIAAAAQDEISVAISNLFGGFGRDFQALSAEAQAYQAQFAGALSAGANRYMSAEAANVQQALANVGIGGGGSTSAASILDPLTPTTPVTAINYPTPFGPIQLIMNVEGLVVTGGTLSVPSPITLAFDAISPAFGTVLSLQSSANTFVYATQTGNVQLAAQAFFQAPGNAVTSFFAGGQTFTGAVSVPPNTGYSSAIYSVPVGGLFTPNSPVVVTLYNDSGTPTTFPLTGTQFGGPFAGIASLF
jgi:hypothetical protein